MMLTNNINDRKSDGRDISSTYDGMQGGENSIRAPKRRQSVILYSKRIDESDNDNGNQNTYDNATNSSSIDETIVKEEKQETKKPMSRLAMAAADWLEEDNDDYDELSNYWNKFEEAKNSKNENASQSKEVTSSSSSTSSPYESVNTTTTEELLDRYYKRRGIDNVESKYKDKIKDAIQKANNASNASEAVKILQSMRPYMQASTF